jgi:hypothetical protein
MDFYTSKVDAHNTSANHLFSNPHLLQGTKQSLKNFYMGVERFITFFMKQPIVRIHNT